MNMDSINLLSDVVLNVLWQAGCLTVVTAIVLLATRKIQLAMQKLVIGLMLIAWLILPIWSLIAVPMNLSFGRIEISRVQESEDQLAPFVGNAEMLAVEPSLIADALTVPNESSSVAANPVTVLAVLRTVGLVWLVGIALGLVRLLVDQVALSRVLRNLRRVEDPLVLELWEEMTSSVSARVKPTLHTTTEIDTPFSTGWLRPRVILPSAAVNSWSHEELFAAMSHELAHWRQRDLLSCRLQRFVQILHWWNPLVRILNRKLSHLQEVVCDTIAVHAGSSQRTYASLLIKIAENLRGPSNIPSAAVGMARNISSLEQRIQTITRKETNMKSIEMKRRNVILACSTAACLALPILGVQLSNADEHRDKHAEAVNEFHFKRDHDSKKKAKDFDGPVAEITIKEDGVTRMIRVPFNDDVQNAKIRDLLKEIEELKSAHGVHRVEKRKIRERHGFDDGDLHVDELDVRHFSDDEDNVQIFFKDAGDRDDFVTTRKTTSRVLIRKKNSDGPLSDDEFELEEGTASLVFETDDGDRVIELRREKGGHDEASIIHRDDENVALFLPEEVEVELRHELGRAQDQIRRSEQQAKIEMKRHLAELQEHQIKQQHEMQAAMRKQQEQLEKRIRSMERQMEELNKENNQMRKRLKKSVDPFGDGTSSN